MEKLIYGKESQLRFSNEEEKFKSIGFLCNQNNCSITIEDNATRGSYTDAYRIKIYNENVTQALYNAMRDANRINCNDFVQELINRFLFECNDYVHVFGDYDEVISNVPKEYIDCFEEGYNS